jgi:hypothetical protein
MNHFTVSGNCPIGGSGFGDGDVSNRTVQHLIYLVSYHVLFSEHVRTPEIE